MRKLLILAFLLCKCSAVIDVRYSDNSTRNHQARHYLPDDIVAIATRPNNYDYDDVDALKRHSLIDDRRNWRKKALLKLPDEHRDWDRRRADYDGQRYADDLDSKSFNGIDRQREADVSSGYRQHRYEDMEKLGIPQGIKSSELTHLAPFAEKEPEKKPITLNCERPHERYEACFAGCASVTCDNPRDRMQPCYPFCEAGCICVHPYVRDDRTHKCVLPEDCTKGLKGIPDLGEDVIA